MTAAAGSRRGPGRGPARGPILVFDSGIGGVSVLRAVRQALPRHAFVYAADDAGFPYGAFEEARLVDRVVALMDRLIARFNPALVIIACNTASTLVLPALRARFAIPFVGTVPAIKPAAEQTRSGLVSVLATPGTMKRDYTRGLIADFATACHVRLVGAPGLAGMAEAEVRAEPPPDAAIWEQVKPCFVEQDGRRTDIIVLACTHYPFLSHRLAALAPWPVRFLDPAPAIARRAASLIGKAVPGEAVDADICVTTGDEPDPTLAAFYRRHGLTTGGRVAV